MPKKKRSASKRRSDTGPLASFERDLREAVDLYTIRLERLIEERNPTDTQAPRAPDPLWTLYQVHVRAIRDPESVHPLDATEAIKLAGAIGLPPPSWALEMLDNTLQAKLQDKSVDLNQRLGFTAEGRGCNSEAERRLQESIHDQSFVRIWGLILLGYTLKDACSMEAGRLQRLPKNWNTTTYFLGYDIGSNLTNPSAREAQLYEKRLKVAERLRQDFIVWRTEIEKDHESVESRYLRDFLDKNRAPFLEEFPTP